MAIREIPLRSDIKSYNFRVDLDNRTFTLDISFYDRAQIWLMNILDDTGEMLISGIPLFPKMFLIDKYQHDARLPQGKLFVESLVSEDANPTADNLGQDVILLYEDVA